MATGPFWLFFLIVLGIGAWWWWRRYSGGMPRGGRSELSIQILATRPLGPRSHLAIVEAAGQRSLIATTAQGVHYLRDLPVPPTDHGSDFSDHLSAEETPPAK